MAAMAIYHIRRPFTFSAPKKSKGTFQSTNISIGTNHSFQLILNLLICCFYAWFIILGFAVCRGTSRRVSWFNNYSRRDGEDTRTRQSSGDEKNVRQNWRRDWKWKALHQGLRPKAIYSERSVEASNASIITIKRTPSPCILPLYTQI